jgi:phosphoglycolate phosphatase
MYIERLIESGKINDRSRVLHFAPERGLWSLLSKVVAPENYHTADIDPARYKFAGHVKRIDLCDLCGVAPDNYYDLILDVHVMEHVHCNIAHTFYHLHRSLTPEGLHLCAVPFCAGYYEETFYEIGDAERDRRFGQNDHVRRFGRRDIDQSLGSILHFDKEFDATRDFSPERLTEANIPPSSWRGLTPDTILHLRKYDMRLLRA